MSGLRISKSLSLPIQFVTSTTAILARKGSGKTYTAKVLMEELVKAGQQFVALDPVGVMHGIRWCCCQGEGYFLWLTALYPLTEQQIQIVRAQIRSLGLDAEQIEPLTRGRTRFTIPYLHRPTFDELVNWGLDDPEGNPNDLLASETTGSFAWSTAA